MGGVTKVLYLTSIIIIMTSIIIIMLTTGTSSIGLLYITQHFTIRSS